jgi:hypothetical protein
LNPTANIRPRLRTTVCQSALMPLPPFNSHTSPSGFPLLFSSDLFPSRLSAAFNTASCRRSFLSLHTAILSICCELISLPHTRFQAQSSHHIRKTPKISKDIDCHCAIHSRCSSQPSFPLLFWPSWLPVVRPTTSLSMLASSSTPEP